jgi:DNA polymerase-3 subunit epsilon
MLEGLRRRWFHRRVACSAMEDYLAASLPSRSEEVGATRFLALDLETTGLDPGRDRIVSVGCVPLDGLKARLAGARHWLVRTDASVGSSATVHHLRDADLEEGRPLPDVLHDILRVLAGRVLVVHHAPVDLQFLNRACRRHCGAPLVCRVVDTLALARRRRRPHEADGGPGLRLDALRRAYGLPRYPAHDALSDALATAELFAATAAHWAGGEPLPLRTLLR